MKKYIALGDLFNEDLTESILAERREVYLAPDVYARISELASALRSVVDAYYDVDNKERLSEAIEAAQRVL